MTGTGELIKRLRDPDCVSSMDARYEAADALEAAERVIAPLAEAANNFDGRRMNRTKFPDHYPIVMGVNVGHARAARDYLARHGGDDE